MASNTADTAAPRWISACWASAPRLAAGERQREQVGEVALERHHGGLHVAGQLQLRDVELLGLEQFHDIVDGLVGGLAMFGCERNEFLLDWPTGLLSDCLSMSWWSAPIAVTASSTAEGRRISVACTSASSRSL